MKNIYIISKCAEISRRSNQIFVRTIENNTTTIPLVKIKTVFIFGNSPVTMPLISYLLSRNINLILLSRNGKFKGIITKPFFKSDNRIRLNQYKIASDVKLCLQIAKHFVTKKWNSIAIYCNLPIDEFKGKINNAKDIDSLLGFEGSISAKYFKEFKKRISASDFDFEKRQYHPSPDPVNAMLSLGYTMFYNLVYPFIVSEGLDPFIGFLHEKRGTHMALCSDIMEEYRIEIGCFIEEMIISKKITTDDFTIKRGNFLFSNKSIGNFINQYNEAFVHNENMLLKIEKSVEELKKLLNYI